MASFDENGKYIKTDWKAGDKITSTKLNKIEESIEAVNDNDISRHVEADARLDALEAKDAAHDKELTKIKNDIADNKAAAELGDYDINSRMTFLEEELNEGIEEVHNVAETVDGKIAKAESDMTSAINTAKEDMRIQVGSAMNVMDTAKEEMNTQVINAMNVMNTAKTEMTTQVNMAKTEMNTQVNNAKTEMTTQVNKAKSSMTTQVNTAKNEMTAQVNTAKAEMTTQVNAAQASMMDQVNQGKADMEAIRDEAVQTVTDETNHAIETINETMWSGCVTPQMYGAVADGVVDDTIPVQNALNSGKSVYFPAGRYKVTSLLQVTNACKISMYKPYPCAYRGDYPLSENDNHMGARIETYSTNGGMLIGDGVEIDGLYMRAMNSFKGVLFKFDGTLGQLTYPSRLRLSHIILDNNSIYTVPESMFDFMPAGTYHHILEDITIGSLRGRQFCEYGFRSIMTTSDTNWANSVRIKNLCIDILADYSLYVEGGPLGCANWVFDCPTIQTYPYVEGDSTYLGKTGHKDIVTFKNMQDVLITGGIIWDLHAASYNRIFNTENSPKIATYCANTFDQIDTYLSEKLQAAADNLNIENMDMTLVGDAATGGNYLTLSDGTNNKSVLIPGAVLDDEQVNAGISNWFSNNAAPTEQIGRNKYNPNDPSTQSGYYYTDGTMAGMFVDEGNGMHTSNLIEAKEGDVIRISKNSIRMGAYYLHMLDENLNWLSAIRWNNDANDRIVDNPDTKYIRITWSKGYFTYEDRATSNICVTVNNGDLSYVPYAIELVGGIGSYLVLQSPNGTQFTLETSDEGIISGKCVNGDVEPPVYATTSDLNALRLEIGLEITETATLLGGDA